MIPVDGYLAPALPEVWFGTLLFAFAMYVFLDGFDFGLGMVYATRDDEAEREQLLAAFGPVWDANEVWLVAFGTLLVAAFPAVYAALLSGHYLAVFGLLFALLARGVAGEFRELNDDPEWRRICDRLFVVGSVAAPFCLGLIAGGWVFGSGIVGLPSLVTGLALVGLSFVAGTAYAALKTRGDLRADALALGRPATAAYLGTLLALVATLVALDPLGAGGRLFDPAPLAAAAATVALPVVGLALAARNRVRAWLWSVGLGAGSLVLLVGTLLYPHAYPATGLTVRDAVAAPVTLNLLTLVAGPFLFVVLGYFVVLYTVFSGPVEESETGYGG
ncbi:cytochrome d ubiquinol oxidase subunit II [Haloparvum sedimenti]|uniref:cytochrome d ubiquinol oxidase subunit II n=1 Tax=Haloparvum sedimenti TaxID=1678448 RepID=UPI00071E8F23|nr:cytochrome d ubiquinol oxidase subunit II [Haloparvum sedimenti]